MMNVCIVWLHIVEVALTNPITALDMDDEEI